MKKFNSFITIIMIAATTGAMAQKSATASSSATIVAPIGIAQAANMSFGNVATNAAGGTVVLTTGGTTSATAGVTLPGNTGGNTGTITAAAFDVTGETGYTYSITLPDGDEITLSDEDASNTMIVDNFVSDPSESGQLSGGTQTISVGAILNVDGGQAAGTYTNETDLTVTVNYN
jgi:hypothetical protein